VAKSRGSIRKGAQVAVVRWRMGPDGYVPEIVHGSWLRATSTDYVLLCGDDVASFPREVWELESA